MNLFGFGGVNVYVIFDDVYYYFVECGLVGNYNIIVWECDGVYVNGYYLVVDMLWLFLFSFKD